MTTRRLLLAAALAALAPAAGRAATSEPHGWAFDPGVSCTSCHTLHNAPGMNLTSIAGNANLCASCHNQGGVGAALGFPWYTEYQATPLAAQPAGRHHRWDAPATNAALGAQPPLDANLLGKLDTMTTPGTPRIQCSTCHDQHNANQGFGGALHVSVTVEQPLPPTVGAPSGAGTGTATVHAPLAAAVAKTYMIEITLDGNVGTAKYHLSNDSGRTWLGWDGANWVTTTTNARTTGPGQNLNDGANVKVTFSGNAFKQGDRWSFYVAYPMLRASIVASALCEDCHRSMVHTSARARGEDATYAPDGTRAFSHPVGVTLGVNGGGYDRTAPRRVDGTLQTATVAYADLPMSVEGGVSKVRCLTCHKVHEAHSNSVLNP
jgi:predicted CXXCH cytochrome family protein